MRPPQRPILQNYKAILFDMNGTFMFDGDRFGPHQDYNASYRAVGGEKLSPAEVHRAVQACHAAFLRDYADPALTECFPALDECVARHSGVAASERHAIALVIARHEVGTVPDWAARALRAIAQQRCAIAVVSNVWAPACHWDAGLEASGVAPLLAAAVFSTQLKAVKPSPLPFLAALKALGVAPDEALFVGDSVARDILPASRLGISTCLVGGSEQSAVADFHLQSIAALAV